MAYPREFFDLQLRFARKASRLTGMPLEQALLACTNLSVRLACGRDFDPLDPRWQGYLAAVRGSEDLVESTYAVYLARSALPTSPPVTWTCGCFSYESRGDGRVRIHFQNVDSSPPLSLERFPARQAELVALFAHLQRNTGGDVEVTGTSWLYNLQAYRRLFPPACVATASAVPRAWQRLPLWGQFLDHRGLVRPAQAALFLDRLADVASADGLDGCFPLQALAVRAGAADFYRHYRL